MASTLDLIGSVVGALGVLLCVAAGIARLSGVLLYGGSEIVTWFLLGVALVAVGCFGKLQALSMQRD